MPLMQIEIPEHLDNKISYYKIAMKNKTKQESIIEIISNYFLNNPDFFDKILEVKK